MAEAVVRYVLGKITEAAYEEALLLYGVGYKVEWAKRELQWVSAFLKDADAKQNKDARVKQWVEDVKEVAYMIEDALDKFFVGMGGGRSKGVLRRVARAPKSLIVKHEVGTEINKIKQRMSEIEKNVTLFELERPGNSSSSGGGSTWQQQPVRPVIIPEIDKTEVVGFQDDIDHICKQLLDQSISRRSVISIVGAGGRGKTTLSTKIYKSTGVGHHFDCRIWITISQEFKIINIVKKMLEKLQINAREVGDEEYFITLLHMSLSKKRYLIVLDDVWSSDHWSQLEVAFPEDNNGSRVLITTRFMNIAKESDVANKPYELRILSKDESQQLLLKKVFPNQPVNKCPDHLLPLINQFAQKCGGWPLALVVLGGILSTKDLDYNIWNEIILKLDWQIEGSKCLDIISTSYDDLPIHLKQCFMYIASFPEDYKVRASTLIQLWIAEGIVQHQSTKRMEKTAEDYLEELVQRCMVRVSKRSWSGRITFCEVQKKKNHILLHT
ncbi:Disease resistance protein (CC-NBS-LRR class) family [Rhynchospora pubera]|uniref:Disease resistance protein (CC-NBS-LRR class) family n=1 Tax=Rhynchospora pubera TaxID=906938 RepID=A0AAV8C0W0_9POAL|nr:Disease resistance protein (CC-NBS-LRR class) family [Rhynchospora pubera]